MKRSLLLLASAMTAFAGQSFNVQLQNCTEFIGIASIPIAKLQPRVPSGYTIAEGPPGFGSLVVRTSECPNSRVDGASPENLKIAQIGVVVVPPDGTGDINNYTLTYSTNSVRLALKLELAGMNVSLDQDQIYERNGVEFYSEISPLIGTVPGWYVQGTVTDPPPGTPQFPFVANWWTNVRNGRVKMSTSIPLLSYGDGLVRVFTRRQSTLGGLLDANSASFGTNLRGVFASATLTVGLP